MVLPAKRITGADQSVRMPRLVCTIIVPTQGRQVFSRLGPYSRGRKLCWIIWLHRMGYGNF